MEEEKEENPFPSRSFLPTAKTNSEANEAKLVRYIKNIQRTPSGNTSIMGEDGFLYLRGYAYIQPDFCSAVLNSPQKAVLEVGAGKGYILADILEKQDTKRHGLIDYTVVELSKKNMDVIKGVFNTYKTQGKKVHLKTANKDMVDFLKDKNSQYDLVFSGFSLHVLPPMDYITALNNLFMAMKDGGRLFLTQHGASTTIGKEIESKQYYPQAYLKELKNGNILPFHWKYNGSNGFTKTFFMSDPISMENLLNAAGFRIETCGLFEEVYNEGSIESGITRYVGIIARKDSSLATMENMFKMLQYTQKAHEIQTAPLLLEE